jgi:4-aminobutyrate aminotransferase/(S)-3-amino-2-methylpropionate transaminase
MGPPMRQYADSSTRARFGSVVYSTAKGSNVLDVDGNRYVDLAAGFGSMLLGHAHPYILRVIELQSARLLQALGDVFPSESKIALLERLARLYPTAGARAIIAQSGADAVSAALKTAMLVTGKPGVLAFRGAYHGLSYGPLAACGFRESYREPFASQLNPHVVFVDYPRTAADLDRCLTEAAAALSAGDLGCVLVEPILGRAGCFIPPATFLPELIRLAHEAGALLVADEIWTGLGRSGQWLKSTEHGCLPDLICLGKGLGGGLPVSACIGSGDVMSAWQREREVVHTATFAGAPLACATALATLDVLKREDLVARSGSVGAEWVAALEAGLPEGVVVRGSGLMIAIELFGASGGAGQMAQRLLQRGYIVSTGGPERETVILTPPLTISASLVRGFVAEFLAALQAPGA